MHHPKTVALILQDTYWVSLGFIYFAHFYICLKIIQASRKHSFLHYHYQSPAIYLVSLSSGDC